MRHKRFGLAVVVSFSLIIIHACSRITEPESGDVIPPATITDLELLWAVDSTAALTWTAPGDDGTRGKASEYDVRYSPSSLEIVSWNGATRVEPVFAPHVPGTAETLLVEGIGIRSTYSFAVKSADNEGNGSGRSNLVWLTTGDKIGPAPISNLKVINVTQRSVAFAWTAPGDDGTVGTVSRYYLHYSRSPLSDLNWKNATRADLTQAPEPPGTRETFVVDGLESSTHYYFAIRSMDDGGNLSALSNVVPQTTARDKIPPGRCSTLPRSDDRAFRDPGVDGPWGRWHPRHRGRV